MWQALEVIAKAGKDAARAKENAEISRKVESFKAVLPSYTPKDKQQNIEAPTLSEVCTYPALCPASIQKHSNDASYHIRNVTVPGSARSGGCEAVQARARDC